VTERRVRVAEQSDLESNPLRWLTDAAELVLAKLGDQVGWQRDAAAPAPVMIGGDPTARSDNAPPMAASKTVTRRPSRSAAA
jgi:hypothetical protein